MKPKIHFHTDCDFFAGCENMLSVLLNDKGFRDRYDVSLSYGYSREYEEGLKKRVNIDFRTYPLKTILRYRADEPRARTILKKIMNNLFRYPLFAYNAYRIGRVVKKESPDIVHINNGSYPAAYSCSSAVYASRISGVESIVYVVNNIPHQGFSVRRKLEFWMDAYVSKNVSMFVTGSAYAGKKLEETLGFRNEQYMTIPNTIAARKEDETPGETRKRRGISPEDIIIANVGIMEERKGQGYLIEAYWMLLKEIGKEFRTVLVLEGKGPMRESLKKQAHDLGIEDKVRFIEEKNIYNLYNCLDVFVLPSIGKEDFPNVILEVMSLGKPVIGTRIAGIPEQVSDNVNGLIVAPKDAVSLKEALKKLVSDSRLREDMGLESRKTFNERFRRDIIVGKYINLYDSLLSKNGPREKA
jgi:glycosyltransferase involved in cell wall biosynthesis